MHLPAGCQPFAPCPVGTANLNTIHQNVKYFMKHVLGTKTISHRFHILYIHTYESFFFACNNDLLKGAQEAMSPVGEFKTAQHYLEHPAHERLYAESKKEAPTVPWACRAGPGRKRPDGNAPPPPSLSFFLPLPFSGPATRTTARKQEPRPPPPAQQSRPNTTGS